MSEDKAVLKINIHGFENLAILKELIDEFLPPTMYEITEETGNLEIMEINLAGSQDKDEIKREIFTKLAEYTGSKPAWGILTGVRPVKLAGEMYDNFSDPQELISYFEDSYYLSHEKASLLKNIYEYQREHCGKAETNSLGVYVGIPFCPTRCLYCSFTSNQVKEPEIDRYIEALLKEIEYTGRKIKEEGLKPESIYFGGGTPTTLSAKQLEIVLSKLIESYDMSMVKEFCVEAGRPDTIDFEKLSVLKNLGVDRISINPQSMSQKTLDIIGRSHSPKDIELAFEVANKVGFDVINADLIAGLPEENPDDFEHSLRSILAMGANNITVHTLAVKRASRLKDINKEYHYSIANAVSEMLKRSRDILKENDFIPYYLYRQKHMAGGFENTGYCKEGKENLYNIRIMDEHQSILALGAGGISKLYYPETNRLQRVPNVSNYTEYINRIDEMCERKEKDFFIKGKSL